MHVNPNARAAMTPALKSLDPSGAAQMPAKAVKSPSIRTAAAALTPDRVDISAAALKAHGLETSRRDSLVAQRPSLTPAQSVPGDAQTSPTLSAQNAAGENESRVFTKSDLADLLNAWGRTKGQEGFNQDLDLNQDGVIDGADLGMLLGSMSHEDSEPETPTQGVFTQSDLKTLLSMFGATQGSRGFDARYDLNGDGRISGADLANLLGMLGPQGG